MISSFYPFILETFLVGHIIIKYFSNWNLFLLTWYHLWCLYIYLDMVASYIFSVVDIHLDNERWRVVNETIHTLYKWLPGHGCVIHRCISFDAPWQLWPPFFGAGFVQLLVLVCLPPPHFFVQLPYDPQFVQPPSTVVENIKKYH